MKDGLMANQATIEAADRFEAAMVLKAARRNQLAAAVANDNTLTAADKAKFAALSQQDQALHQEWYDLGTEYIPGNFPQGGST